MKYEVKADTFEDGTIELTECHSSDWKGIADSYCKSVIDTKDQAIREALISLGWTPPEEKNNDQNT